MSEVVFDIYVLVKETGTIIHAREAEWCKVRTSVPGREWLYCFEETKGQAFPDTDYEDPVLHVERLNGRLQVSIYRYSGQYHVDVFVFGRLLWEDVGGAEKSQVGESSIVELPEPPPPEEPPYIPPEEPPSVVPPGVEEVVPEIPPVVVEVPPVVVDEVVPVPVIINWMPVTDLLEEIKDKMVEVKDEMEQMVVKANTYLVRDLDLSIARTYQEFLTEGFAMTVLICTGTMDLRLGILAVDGITISPLVYPQTVVIDRMDFDRFFVNNLAQPGKVATIIVWRREVP